MSENNDLGSLVFSWSDIGDLFEKVENAEEQIDELEVEANNISNNIDDLEKRINGIHIDIIQVVAIVVSVLALILGNIIGYIALPKNISPNNLIGYLFIINVISLTGISLLIFMIKFLFLKSKWNKYYLFFLIPIGAFYLIGFILIL